MKLISFSPFVSLLLTPVLVVAPLWSQTPVGAPNASPNAAPVQDLQLRLIDSDGAKTPAGSQAVKGFTLEVRDSAGKAVPEAAVALRLPDSGATGSFPDGTHAAVSYTDSQGRAQMPGIQWSATPGPVSVRVTAIKGTAHAGMLFEETLVATSRAPSSVAESEQPVNPVLVQKASPPAPQPGTLAGSASPAASTTAPPPAVSVTGGTGQKAHSTGKWIAILAVVAGAGAGAAMAMKGGKSGASSTSTASPVTVGNPTISVGPGH